MIYFVRHGQSQANVDKVFAGPHLFAPLTVFGRKQAEEEGRRMLDEKIHIDHIIASPIERAHETAQIIARTIGYDPNDIQIDPRWAEYDMGELSGQAMEGVTPAERVSALNAEEPKAFQARVRAALDDAATFEGNVLIVSHAGVGRMIEATKQGLDPAHFYELEGYPNARVIKIDT
jgi:probable phosphoglycerate mutase